MEETSLKINHGPDKLGLAVSLFGRDNCFGQDAGPILIGEGDHPKLAEGQATNAHIHVYFTLSEPHENATCVGGTVVSAKPHKEPGLPRGDAEADGSDLILKMNDETLANLQGKYEPTCNLTYNPANRTGIIRLKPKNG